MRRHLLTRAAAALGVALLIEPGSALAQQQPGTPNPGARWTDEQLRRAVAPARVGRKLTPKSWPASARVAVCLSFDVDNESYLLARGETSATTLSAADFGAETGLPRILKLLGVTETVQIADAEYDNLFIVVPTATGPPTLLRLKY